MLKKFCLSAKRFFFYTNVMNEHRRSKFEDTDRAATNEEIAEAGELAAFREMKSTEETTEAAKQVEAYWKEILEGPNPQRFLNERKLKAKITWGAKGKFEKLEIRNSDGRVIFYSDDKAYAEAENKFRGKVRLN